MNRITLILLFLVFYIPTSIFSQEVSSEFEQCIKSMNVYEIQKYISENYLNNEEYEMIKKHILMRISNVEENPETTHLLYYVLLEIELFRSNYTEAMQYASSMKYYADLIKDNHYSIVSIICMALIRQQQKLYDLAIDLHFQALEMAENNNNISMIQAIKINIANLKIDLGDLDESIVIIEKNLNNIITNSIEYSKRFLPEIYNTLCRAYTLKKNYNLATKYCSLCKEQIEQRKWHFIEVDFLQNLANLEIHKGNYQKGQDLLLLTKEQIINRKTIGRLPYQYLYQGKLFYHLGRYQDAIQELLRVVNPTSNEKISFFNEEEANLLLALSYSKSENKEKTQLYYDKAILADTRNQKQKSDIITKIASEEELIEIEQTLNEVKLENKSKNRLILLLLLALIIFGSITIIRNDINKRKNNLKFKKLITQLSEQKSTPVLNNAISDVVENQKTYVEKFARILKELQVLEKTDFYLKQDCNTFKTAKKLNTNVNYLSKAIKAKYNYDFSHYINKQRINYTIKKLKEDPVFRSYSISAISKDVGYKSTNTFVKHFKKQTQLLPSYYIKKLNS